MTSPTKALPNADVCDQCRQLDLQRLFECMVRSWKEFREFYIPIKGSEMWFHRNNLANCSMCSILSQSIYDKNCKKILYPASHETYGLIAVEMERTSIYREYFSPESNSLILLLVESYPELPSRTDSIFGLRPVEHILGHGYALLQPRVEQHMSPIRAPSERFNAQQALTWISRCRHTHDPCRPPRKRDIHDYRRLIDCHELTIVVDESSTPYIALSYVWGSSRKNAAIHTNEIPAPIPENLPLVIMDAISVTKSLGFRYLWVDRLCIDQVNRDIKHRQLQEMDAIYAGSELTIIGAAGQDGDYGLPGVSSCPRTTSFLAKVGGTEAAYIQHPYGLIRKSKWYSRGWTYQEAFLSRRRLVFLDNQTYFECMSDNFCEMLPCHPKRKWEGTRQRSFSRITGTGLWNGKSCEYSDPTARYIDNIVSEYTIRDLSYDSDSLIALSGVLHHLKAQSNFSHILGIPWGIPQEILVKEDLHRHWEDYSDNDVFIAGLCWFHIRSCWHAKRKPRRRLEFPSWTWAGWAGRIEYTPVMKTTYPRPFIKPDILEIFLEGHDGLYSLLHSVERFALSAWERPPASPILGIKARALSPKYFSLLYKHGGIWRFDYNAVYIYLSEGMGSDNELVEALGNYEQWRCVFLGKLNPLSRTPDPFFLILRREQGAEIWSRVGSMQLGCQLDDWEKYHFPYIDTPWEEYRIR